MSNKYAVRLVIILDKQNQLKLSIDNPDDVSALTIVGALEFVKMGLQRDLLYNMIEAYQENKNAHNSV